MIEYTNAAIEDTFDGVVDAGKAMGDADKEELDEPVDFGPVEDTTKKIIKVVGVGGGGCNAVNNMFKEGISNVSFAVCNTDSQSLSRSPVPVKLLLGDSGLGAGANPELGKQEAIKTKERVKQLFNDSTRMCFITAGMGGGTGTGAAPIITSVAKSMGILTIGIVTIPFYFEKKRKIIKALKGVEEMRKSVDSLLIINNESICDVYSDSELSIKDAFKAADNILCNAAKSISELITIEGNINLDFRDVETTMRGGGGAIMAVGRARGEKRVEQAIVNALESPLLYGSDISNANKILFNIYTGSDKPLFVSEMREIDAFMYGLNPNIDVIWGTSDDDSLGEDAKVIILATGLDNRFVPDERHEDYDSKDEASYEQIISKLYREPLLSQTATMKNKEKEAADKQHGEARPANNGATRNSAGLTVAAQGPVRPGTTTPEAEIQNTASQDFTHRDAAMRGNAVSEHAIQENAVHEATVLEGPSHEGASGNERAATVSFEPPHAKEDTQTSPKETPAHRPTPFLDRLKKHLKKGLTELASDINE